MLDLNIGVMLIEAGIFLVTLILLKMWLFDPLVKFMDEREEKLKKSLEMINANSEDSKELEELQYYFQRHIELDGDEHGPMAFEMLSLLCDTDEKWNEAQEYATKAIQKRAEFWDAIHKKLLSIP